jgi:putative tryptophan/tyrosine transport system substrate-binding protein
MKRREFITLLGSTAAAWPVLARAQQRERMRRIGVLMNLAADDPEALARVTAFVQGLQALGWTVGRNVRIDYRWATGDADRLSTYAAELVALSPDIILTGGNLAVRALRQATHTIPVVFAQVVDPVGNGFVASLAKPGGNVTGFSSIEFGMSGKLLALLKELAPKIMRVAVIRDASAAAGIGQWGAIQTVAPSFGVELSPIDPRDAGDLQRGITMFARGSTDGLIVTGSTLALLHRELITTLAAQHRLPAVYTYRYFATAGGLMSYGPDPTTPFRNAAGYVDRILNGETPADLPVQAPTKYELVLNMKTARALGIDVPPTLLATADEVIE